MKVSLLSTEDILSAYGVVSKLYPYIPSLSIWRSWEFAAYQHFEIDGHVLDLGCGDGHYFKLLWPSVANVVGVDIDPTAAERGRQSGVYSQVHVSPAHKIPEDNKQFDYVFANCSLEHMNHLEEVLREICRCLKPGGKLLCSVVTDKFVHWSLLPYFVSVAGFEEVAKELKNDFINYHQLANPLTSEEWQEKLLEAQLIPEEYIPIVPKYNTGFFLLFDSLWHIKNKQGGEFGDIIFPFLSSNPSFPTGFRKMLEGLLEMETDFINCSGAVFCARRSSR